MDVWILNREFMPVGIIDQYKSFIWTERYNQAGDFELVTPITEDAVSMLKRGAYIWIDQSDYKPRVDAGDVLMIVESLDMTTSIEQGNFMTVTGRSLESLLERRVMYDVYQFDKANFQDAYVRIINENIVNPSDAGRKIENFKIRVSSDPIVTAITFSAQYWGDNIYKRVCELCEEYDIGFHVLLDAENYFVFEFYAGVDRGWDQTNVPWVVFSPEFDNLSGGEYLENEENYKTAALVVGAREIIRLPDWDTPDAESMPILRGYKDHEGRTMWTYIPGNASGLDRREVLLDATDVDNMTDLKDEEVYKYKYNGQESDQDVTSEPVPKDVYIPRITERGNITLKSMAVTRANNGDTVSEWQFMYGKDYYLGDLVQIRNDFGFEYLARVSEVVRSWDENGYKVTPTFTKKEE